MCFLPIKTKPISQGPRYCLMALYFKFIFDPNDNKTTGAYFILSHAFDKQEYIIPFQPNTNGFQSAFKQVIVRILGWCEGVKMTKACVYVADLAKSPFTHNNKHFLSTLQALTQEDCTFEFHMSRQGGAITTTQVIIQFTLKPENNSTGKSDKIYTIKIRGFKQSFKTDIFSDSTNIPPKPTTLNEIKQHAQIEFLQLTIALNKTTNLFRDFLSKEIKSYGGKIKVEPSLYYNNSISSIAKNYYFFNEYYTMREHHFKFFSTPLDLKTEDFFRRAFRGGLFGVYKPLIKDGFFYDINGLYSYILRYYPVPTLNPIFLPKVHFSSDFFGFVEAKVYSPHHIYIPVLPFINPKLGHRLTFPNGTFTAVFFSEELKYAQTLGVQILETYSGYEYRPYVMFNNTMKHFNTMRRKNSKNPLESKLAKLLANSLYGSFATRTDKFFNLSHQSHNLSITPRFLLQHNSKTITQIQSDHSDFNHTQQQTLKDFLLTRSTPVAAAAAAYARIYLHKLISELQCNIFYIDTDAIVVDQPLTKEYVHATKPGKFKLVTKINKGIFLAPKVYFCIDKKGSKKIAFAGISKINSDKLTYEDFFYMYKQRKFEILNQNTPSTAYHFYTPLTLRREPIFNDKDLCIDTKPLVVDPE